MIVHILKIKEVYIYVKKLVEVKIKISNLLRMTRINVGIDPLSLPDELLLAVRYNLIITCREIKRLPFHISNVH